MVGVQALKCLHAQRTTSFHDVLQYDVNTASCCLVTLLLLGSVVYSPLDGPMALENFTAL